MSEAKRDQNMIVTLLGVSNADGTTPVVLWADPVTHRLLVSAASSAHSILSASHDDSVVGTVVLGDIIIGNSTPKWERLAGNITTTKKFLVQTGNGVISAAPSWGTIIAADIPDISATYALTGHNHSGVYSVVGHDHAGVYAPVLGADDNYVTDAEKTAIGTIGDKVAKSTFDAYSILYADTDNTPAALTVGTNTVVGRIAAGIVAIAIDSDLASVSANDDTIPSAKATKAMGDLKLPLAGGTMTGNITLGENTAVALDPAGSADEKWSGITCSGTAGATIAVGDLIYLDVTATEWLLADADAAATSGDVPLGLCILAANDGEATNILLIGTMRSAAFPASIDLGAPVYVGVTAGDIQAAQPTGTDDVIRRVGWAISAEPNTIYFNPSNDYTTHV